MKKRMQQVTLTAALLLVSSWAWAAKPADNYPSDVAWKWFEQLYDVVKAEKTTPPPASRIYGITAVALYESIVAGTTKNRSLVGQLNDLTYVPQPDKNQTYDWPAVSNAVLADTIRGLYPEISQASLDAINNLEQHFASQRQKEVPEEEYSRSVAHGKAVARAILDWAANDRYSTFNNCLYVPAPVAGAWRPTPPAYNPNPLQPCWGMIRPMVLTSGDDCPPPGHPQFSTRSDSEFYAGGLQVYNVNLHLTNEQKTIADFWADNPGATGTPPGHWIAIASQLARSRTLSLAAAAEAYARVGIAVHDAFIECWNRKYYYDLQRPVTYINDNIDPNWRPYLVTPSFPTYTSGHSTQSGASARVLTNMLGIIRFTDTTNTDHGLTPPEQPRTFDSFDQAAAEAAISRLYAGIHFSFDNDDGLGSGHCIAQTVHDRVRFTHRAPSSRDDNNNGIDDQFENPSIKQNQWSVNDTVGSGNENSYDLMADSNSLSLTATAEPFELLDALNESLRVEIYSPSGNLLAASPLTIGRAVVVTVPSVPGTYKVKVKNLGQGSVPYETLLITGSSALPRIQ